MEALNATANFEITVTNDTSDDVQLKITTELLYYLALSSLQIYVLLKILQFLVVNHLIPQQHLKMALLALVLILMQELES